MPGHPGSGKKRVTSSSEITPNSILWYELLPIFGDRRSPFDPSRSNSAATDPTARRFGTLPSSRSIPFGVLLLRTVEDQLEGSRMLFPLLKDSAEVVRLFDEICDGAAESVAAEARVWERIQ